MTEKWDKLQIAMEKDTEIKDSLVFLHPGETRNYTDDEISAIEKKKDFESRLYVTLRPHDGHSVFLRTRHSDNHEHDTDTFDFVRDYLKASSSTQSYTAAKATLTRLLTIMIDTSGKENLTFATTMASALSRNAKNIDFEWGHENDVNALLTTGMDEDELRTHLCILMHIIFTKMKQYQFMVADEGSNAYRLFYCRSKTSPGLQPFLIAFFSFALQICLTVYVIVQVKINYEEGTYFENGKINYIENMPLAFLTSVYSAILAYPAVQEIPDAFDVFKRRIGIFQVMDFIINGILPYLLLLAGFFVIWGQESYIESVLNCAALLFIPDIDDALPSLLGFREEGIIKNFFIGEAMEEFDSMHDAMNSGMDGYKKIIMKKYAEEARMEGMGVQFADYFITNWKEQASSPGSGNLFQPFQVRKGKNAKSGDQIDPSFFITSDCLIKKITWKYTIYGPAKNTSKPRVGYLKLEMVAGYTVEYERPHEDSIDLGEAHTLEGVYLITTFQMSNDILRLRVCGSQTAAAFKTALEYYTLWPLSSSAAKLLDKEIEFEDRRNVQRARSDHVV